MTILVTGAAGFIGAFVARALLERGERVIGLDSLDPYYDPALKRHRLEMLEAHGDFRFVRADVADFAGLVAALGDACADIRVVIHLAAQAGVRYSLENPFAYAHSNLLGHLAVLELCRHRLPRLERLVYASSSSVYGANTEIPFAEDQRVDRPVSLYAATKRADELMSETYARLYGLPQIGLRFFTVYGPMGRPDMAYFAFADAIVEGRPIRLFNHGRMRRDFTWIEDVVAGVLAAAEYRPARGDGVPHRIFNLGNHRPVELLTFVRLLERAIGREAVKEFAPMQPGDVVETCADITAARRELGFAPTTPLEEGLPRFVAWHRRWRGY